MQVDSARGSIRNSRKISGTSHWIPTEPNYLRLRGPYHWDSGEEGIGARRSDAAREERRKRTRSTTRSEGDDTNDAAEPAGQVAMRKMKKSEYGVGRDSEKDEGDRRKAEGFTTQLFYFNPSSGTTTWLLRELRLELTCCFCFLS